MKPLRLVIVVPRFWPHVGDSEIFAAHLADELAAIGAQPLVLSSKWSPEWPESIFVRNIPVRRLKHAPRGGWNTILYMMELVRWLRRSRSSFDAVYVLSLRHEAYATVVALRKTLIPVVLRCQESGPGGDCLWQGLTPFGDRIRAGCHIADAIVAAGADVAQELATCGYDSRRIHVIPGGAEPMGPRTSDHRFRARSYLAEVNQDLATAEYSPVVVWIGRLMEVSVFLPLLRAWRDVVARWPSARLWLIGDGPARDALYSQIVEWELQYQVLMPGTFEDLSDILLAADLFVSPQPNTGGQMIIQAMAAGLPVLAADSPESRAILEPGRTGFIVPSTDHSAWVAQLSFLCDNPSAVAKIGLAAQKVVQQRFSRTHMAQQHLDLFQRLVREKQHLA